MMIWVKFDLLHLYWLLSLASVLSVLCEKVFFSQKNMKKCSCFLCFLIRISVLLSVSILPHTDLNPKALLVGAFESQIQDAFKYGTAVITGQHMLHWTTHPPSDCVYEKCALLVFGQKLYHHLIDTWNTTRKYWKKSIEIFLGKEKYICCTKKKYVV